ncbi:MAG: DNA repair protein RecN, partial [Comamonadaceae bacterium]
VTHLPQVAAFADHHLVVAKRQTAGRTESGVTPLDGVAREKEIARMLGGEKTSATSLAHARELLGKPASEIGA